MVKVYTEYHINISMHIEKSAEKYFVTDGTRTDRRNVPLLYPLSPTLLAEGIIIPIQHTDAMHTKLINFSNTLV